MQTLDMRLEWPHFSVRKNILQRRKRVLRAIKRYSIMIKRSINQEVFNNPKCVYMPKNRASKCMKQKWTQLKGEK